MHCWCTGKPRYHSEQSWNKRKKKDLFKSNDVYLLPDKNWNHGLSPQDLLTVMHRRSTKIRPTAQDFYDLELYPIEPLSEDRLALLSAHIDENGLLPWNKTSYWGRDHPPHSNTKKGEAPFLNLSQNDLHLHLLLITVITLVVSLCEWSIPRLLRVIDLPSPCEAIMSGDCSLELVQRRPQGAQR